MKKNLIAIVTIIRLIVKNGGPDKWLAKMRVESQEQDRLILALRQDQEDMQYTLSLNKEREEGWQNRFRYLQYCYQLSKLTLRIAKIPQKLLPSIETTHNKLSQMLVNIRSEQVCLRSYRRVVIDGLMEELETLVNIAEMKFVDKDKLEWDPVHEEWCDPPSTKPFELP